MDKGELIEIIQQSFLSAEKKQELMDLLKTKITKETFFDFLNQFLMDATDERAEKYRRVMKEMNDAFERLDQVRLVQKQERDSKLEIALKGIEMTDFHKKKEIMDVYYAEIEKADQQDEQTLKKVIADAIKTTFVE